MKRIGLPVLLLLAVLLPAIAPAQNKTMTDEMLWDHLQRRSMKWYEQYVRTMGGEVDPGEWKAPIERVLLRIAAASGHGPVRLSYCIISNNTFNAGAFPGGQFVIHSEVLRVIDDAARNAMKAEGTTGRTERLQAWREAIIAPLLAHEMAHYYNRHTFYSIKKLWNFAGKTDETVTLAMMKHSREYEFDADMTGFLYLKKAGYDPGSMVDLLNFLNALTQEGLKRGGANISYFASHPTAHERLVKIDGRNAVMHRWAAEMEKVFEDIQFGKNLAAAVASLDMSLQKYPGNLYLEKARAVALHKQWLSTVTLRNQVLKAVIMSPSFRDDMVFQSATKRGGGIPGNKEIYSKARKAYEKLVAQALDSEFQSNYAVLLCYSADREDIKRSIDLAENAANMHSTVATVSNLAMVYYLNQKNDDAKRILVAISGQIDQHYTKLIGAAATDEKTAQQVNAIRAYFQQCRYIDKAYVPGDYTPILNLALVLVGTGDLKGAKALAADYFRKYDSTSMWGQHLSRITGVPIPPRPKDAKTYPVKGVKVGDSMDKVMKTWGRPADIVQSQGEEFWVYKAFDTALIMEQGSVKQILLGSDKSPRAGNAIGVGQSKETIEKSLGAHRMQSGGFLIYGEANEIAIEYIMGISNRIIVLH